MKTRFTHLAAEVLNASAEEARILGHTYIGTEHLLLSLLNKSGSVACGILLSHDITYGATREIAKEISGGGEALPVDARDMTPRLRRAIENSALEAAKYGGKYIGTEHLLLSLICEKETVAAKLIIAQGASISEIQNDITVFLGDINGKGLEKNRAQSSPLPTLLQYGKDITESAAAGLLDPVIGRENETERVIQILSRRSKNNPCLIGEPGVGKTAVVEGLAIRIAKNDVPETLAEKSVIALDIGAMIAGAKYRGEFEDRMKKVMREIAGNKNIILFIDELHTIVGAGAAEGAVDAANILKPALSRGEIQLIGATTTEEFRRHIERDAALERRFQSVAINEPSEEESIRIIKGVAEKYEAHHKIKIPDEAISAAVGLSARYINDRFLPDKAIDLIDEAASRKRIRSFTLPESLSTLSSSIKELRDKKEEAIRMRKFSAASAQREKLLSLSDEYEREKKKWLAEREKLSLSLCADDISEVVTMWTKIPVSRLEENEKNLLLGLDTRLCEKIIGQENAVEAVCRAVRRGRLGLSDPARPVGSFIFSGPTGVGKTELARELAYELFGSREAMIRLDMSEYMEKQSASKIIGSPPGYVGYNDGAGLCERVRRAPYSVVLFDEIEKAHPDIFNLFLQILDDGVLTDSRGTRSSFKNAVIIMTSNIGADMLERDKRAGFTVSEDIESERVRTRKNVLSALSEHFRPEFLGRVDEIVIFEHLSRESIEKITDMMLVSVKSRIETLGVEVEFDGSIRALLAERGFDRRSGAREARRVCEKIIEDSFAEHFIRGDIAAGDLVLCTASGERADWIKKQK